MLAFFTVSSAVSFCRAAQRALLLVEWPQHLLTLPYACEMSRDGAANLPALDTATTPDSSSSSTALTSSGSPPLIRGIRVRMGIHVGK